MQDVWWHLKDTDSFTIYMSLSFAAAVCWFIHEIVHSPTLAWLSTPFLTVGGVVAPTLLAQHMITLSYDKTINAVCSIASGTLGMLLAILFLNWLWSLFVEYNVRRTKLVTVPANRAPRIRIHR
jgi:uncharacterized membrane protein